MPAPARRIQTHSGEQPMDFMSGMDRRTVKANGIKVNL
ncbi:Uncharacterized protein ToN1_25980 [Aromatoleum petrolei]|nr:Uncharacterized protein ToN1_25980 [Aromatoleum petrolei]